MKGNLSNDQLTFISKEEDAPFIEFLITMKGEILDWTFNVLRRAVDNFLDRTMRHVELHIRWIDNPVLRHVLEVAYGSGISAERKKTSASPDVLEVLKRFASEALRNVLTEIVMQGLRHAMEWKSSADNFDLADKQSRRKIIELIFVSFNAHSITNSLCNACRKCLKEVHKSFLEITESLSRVNDFATTNTTQQLQEMAYSYIGTLGHLVLRGLALQFLLIKGQPTMGPILKYTKHGKIYNCSGWTDERYTEACVVKVIEKEALDAEVWAQTSIDLLNAL